MFWNPVDVGFQMIGLENWCCPKVIVFGGTLLKSVWKAGFFKCLFWLWNVYCENCWTNLTCLCCKYNAFFIRKKSCRLVQFQFYKWLQILKKKYTSVLLQILKKKYTSVLYFFFFGNLIFFQSVVFHHKICGLSKIGLEIVNHIINMMIFIIRSAVILLRIGFNELMNDLTILILMFVLNLQSYMQYVMSDAWCVMFQTWNFVRSRLSESRGDQQLSI